jgi:mono/diheme cytochrome c family protein
MKIKLGVRIVLSAGVLAAIGTLCAPARSDDKSAATFKQKCATCHGPDGKADTPAGKAMKVRSFASPEVAKMTDEQLADIIEKGQGKMPKYGASLKPEEIKAMVGYIRTLAK